MLDKKQILAIFLFEFKMDHKAVETNCNIHNAFGSGTADECTMVQDVLQRSWEPWTWGTHYWSLEVDDNNWEPLFEGDSVTTTWEAAKKLSVNCSVVFWHLKQVGNVKKLRKWVPLELTKKKKKCCFKVSSSLILYKSESFLSWIVMGRKVDCIWQPVTTSLEVGPRSSKVLLKAKLAPKKGHGHCLVVCSHLIQ